MAFEVATPERLSVAEQLRFLNSGSARCAALPKFGDTLKTCGLLPLRSTGIEILQVNLGKLCNQSCKHCHVDAGPTRREIMTRETMQHCLNVLAGTSVPVVDLTGGAPEMNPDFRWFVSEIRRLGRKVLVRCNLTIIEAGPKFADLPEFFAENRVEVVSSLPHYSANWTNRQRGDHVFDKSIRALKRLNAVGYGDEASELCLSLVHNPVGAFLPGDQKQLESDFKRELLSRFGIRFNRLFTITNMPISRFLEALVKAGALEEYLENLVAAFNPAAASGVMCRNTLSVGWDGRLYDCDFNQMLEIPVLPSKSRTIDEFNLEALDHRSIALDQHCYGCTAGSGSSCGGQTA